MKDKPLQKNPTPTRISEGPYNMYLMTDQVHLKPKVSIQQVFYQGSIYDKPEKQALLSITLKMLKQKIDEEIGDAANKADIGFSIFMFDHFGLGMRFTGYSDKIDVFIQKFYEMLTNIAETGFQEEYRFENAKEQ